MQHLRHTLKDNDWRELNQFFLNHSARSFSLVSLDGFFYGLLCLPVPIKPDQWIKDVLPQQLNKDKILSQRATTLTYKYYNAVFDILTEGDIEPRFNGSSKQTRVWLEGFGRAFRYDTSALQKLADAELQDLRDSGEDENLVFSAIVLSFAMDFSQASKDEDSDDEDSDNEEQEDFLRTRQGVLDLLEEQTPEENQDLISDLIVTVYDLLEPERATHEQQKPVGRNQPCPCGSGKPYKYCHGKQNKA
jgi:yecA family protein